MKWIRSWLSGMSQVALLPARTPKVASRFPVCANSGPLADRRRLDDLLSVPAPDNVLAIHYVGVGMAGMAALRQLQRDHHQRLPPAAKGHAYHTALSGALQERKPIHGQLPNMLVMLAGFENAEQMPEIRRIACRAREHGIVTVMVVPGTVVPGLYLPELQTHDHRLCMVSAPVTSDRDERHTMLYVPLYRAAVAVTAKLLYPGVVCLDLCDWLSLYNLSRNPGPAVAWAGYGAGYGTARAVMAVESVLQSLEAASDKSQPVTGAWVSIRCGADFRIEELAAVIQQIEEHLTPTGPICAADYFDHNSDGLFELSAVLFQEP